MTGPSETQARHPGAPTRRGQAPGSGSSHVSLRLWIRITFLGWLLGIVLVVAIALVGEVVGVRGSQISVGLGMGLGVGIAQERALRPLLGPSQLWRWASAMGLAIPFLVVDLARMSGRPIPYSLYVAIVAAGLTAGGAQAYLLRPRGIAPGSWIGASCAGWIAASLMAALADSFTAWSPVRGLAGALLYLGLVCVGGLLLGAATSVPLRRFAATTIPAGR